MEALAVSSLFSFHPGGVITLKPCHIRIETLGAYSPVLQLTSSIAFSVALTRQTVIIQNTSRHQYSGTSYAYQDLPLGKSWN